MLVLICRNERTQAEVSEAGINIFITPLREQQYQNYTAKFHRLTDHSLQPKKELKKKRNKKKKKKATRNHSSDIVDWKAL